MALLTCFSPHFPCTLQGRATASASSRVVNELQKLHELALPDLAALPSAMVEKELLMHASGYGVALVPRRALALYRRKESLVTLPLAEHFEREIVVLTRKHRKLPPHVAEFVKNILF